MNSLTPSPALPLGALSTPLVVFLALVAVGAAVALHWLRAPRAREGRIGLAAAQLAATCAAWWLTIAAAHRWLVFHTSWPVALWCVLGGLGTEAILALYRFERRSTSRGIGATLVGLRLALLLIVLFWLTQPVLRMHKTIPVDRYIAVLIDSSASMGLTDTEPTARERLDLARLFELPLPNRPDEFQDTHRQLADLLRQFNAQLNSLELLGSSGAGSRQMQDRIVELVALSTKAGIIFAGIDKSLAEIGVKKLPLDSEGLATVASLEGQLKSLRDGSFSRLRQLAAKNADSTPPNVVSLRDDLRNVAETLGRLSQEVAALPAQLDEAYWRSLPPAKRAEIEKQTNVARSVIARKVLSLAGKDHKPFVEELHDGYKLKFYLFASQVVQVPPSTFLPEKKAKDDPSGQAQNGAGSVKNGPPETVAAADAKSARPGDKNLPGNNKLPGGGEPKLTDAWRSATDFSAALRQCYQDVPKGSDLSGVLIIGDGRHNVEDDPWEPIAHELAAKQVPISTVIIGTRKVPKDAAVAGIDAPGTLLVGDKLLVKARVKIDGYRGQEILAKLYRGTEEVGHQAIKVPEDHHVTSVEFSDLPKKAGMLAYRVELLSSSGAPLQESVMINNSAERQVSVTDDPIKLLVLDARPRWEFRYLKNLFAGRDKTVHLQYMLTNPDWIEGVPHPAPVHVSASRPYGAFEGNRLPENEQEWMKFDVVVLGDVSPTTLDKPTLKSLEKFVNKRGGTLVVIAGEHYMPHAFAGSPLAEMLPVRFQKADGWLGQGPDVGGAFRWALTPEGKESVLMKLSESPGENADLWASFPIFWWRHPTTRAKDGANVLAYAESAYPNPEGTSGGREKDLNKRQRDNALVCWQRWGAGKVLMLTTDRSWRMRYEIGDVYHHTFWGQVLRWATEDKLPGGTTLARLGTDKPHYSVGQAVTIKAHLLDEKADPVVCDDLVAKVFRGDLLLATIPLAKESGMPGRYRADVPKDARLLTAPGKIRIELAGPSVEKLLSSGTEHKAQLEVAVTDAKTTSELIELTADDTIPNKLASMTRPGRVVTPAEATTLLDAFGERNGVFPYSTDISLWDWWPVLLLFLLAGSGEWILRKKAGLV